MQSGAFQSGTLPTVYIRVVPGHKGQLMGHPTVYSRGVPGYKGQLKVHPTVYSRVIPGYKGQLRAHPLHTTQLDLDIKDR